MPRIKVPARYASKMCSPRHWPKGWFRIVEGFGDDVVRELLGFATPTNTTPSTTTRLSKIESTVRYLGIKVDDAIEIAENIHLISDATANQRTWSAAVSEVADRG